MTPASTIVGTERTKGLHAKKKTARLWVTFAVVFIVVLLCDDARKYPMDD